MTNMQGLISMKYCDLTGEEIGQFYSLTSGINGSRLSSFSIGIKYEELAQSDLPVKANKIWCVNLIGHKRSDFTDLIILGLQEGIVILQAGDQISTYKENLGFVTNKKTLLVNQIYEDDTVIGYL